MYTPSVRQQGWAMIMTMLLVLLISIASAGALSLLQREKKRLDNTQISIAKEMIIEQIIYLLLVEKKQILSLKTILIDANKSVKDKLTCSVPSSINEVSYIAREGNGLRFEKAATHNAPRYTSKNRFKAWLISQNTHNNKFCGQYNHFRMTQQPLTGSERCRLYSVKLCVSAVESLQILSRVVKIEMMLP